MKVGDIIVSKITLKNRLIENKEYVIIDIDADRNNFYDYSLLGKFIVVISNNEEFRFYDRNLNNYFYTMKEFRKLKLEKLNLKNEILEGKI
jgi:hypothetical protein